MTDIHIISDSLTLAEKCRQWRDRPYLTIDTEFLRTSTYWPMLCLIQVGWDGEGVAIDPLAEGLSLEPLWEIIQNPNIVKVFHDARQDIEIIHHLTNACPAPIFDTQIAAQACGFGDSVSYEQLAQQLVKKRIDKSARVTDWSKRPLSEKQMIYALSDVTHLCDIYEELDKKLKKTNRLEWVEPEFELMTFNDFYETPPEQAWKSVKFKAGNACQQLLLEAIAEWREIQAQTLNKPRGWIMRDDLMRALMVAAANRLPLEKVSDMSKKLFSSVNGDKLQNSIIEIQNNTENMKVEKNKNTQNNKNENKISMLKLLLKIQCERYQVAPRLIANRAQIEEFAANPNSDNRITKDFRYEVFGKYALALMNGEISLTLHDGKTDIVKTTPPAPKQV